MSTNPFLRGRLIAELDRIFDGVVNRAFFTNRNHRFETAVANAVSEYTDQRLQRYDREVIDIERRRITQLEQRVTALERRVTILEQRIATLGRR